MVACLQQQTSSASRQPSCSSPIRPQPVAVRDTDSQFFEARLRNAGNISELFLIPEIENIFAHAPGLLKCSLCSTDGITTLAVLDSDCSVPGKKGKQILTRSFINLKKSNYRPSKM